MKPEERYILAIYGQQNRTIPSEFVRTGEIAKKLRIKPSSVTEMIVKLKDRGHVVSIKSKGVFLTDAGTAIALKILRSQLLWECFFVTKLGVSVANCKSIIEKLEVINEDDLLKKLSTFLGNPLYGVSGEPIPTEDGKIDHAFGLCLSMVQKGFKGKVVAFKESDEQFLDYISRRRIYLGCEITVLDVCAYDSSLDIQLDNSSAITLSQKVGGAIVVVDTENISAFRRLDF